MPSVLTAVDVLGIQRFVFASRRLRNTVGASALVRRATEKGEGSALESVGAEANAKMCAGGNILLAFADMDEARGFAARYSRWIIKNTPGLEVVVAHHQQQEGEPFAEAHRQLFAQLDLAKAARTPSAPLLGLSVTAICRETGLPASYWDDDRPVSTMIHATDDDGAIDDANAPWKKLLSSPIHGKTPRFPKNIDELGRSHGDTSLIAVVHIDGNNIGKCVSRWLSERAASADDYRLLSERINGLGRMAMETVVRRVLAGVNERFQFGAVREDSESTSFDLRFDLTTSRSEVFLPLRPVLLGGDDLTFLCDGRIALDLAVAGLEGFRAEAGKHDDLVGVGACAGISIVRSHQPFYRAAEQAHALCRSAKKKVQAENARFGIDWHVGAMSPAESVEAMRIREYPNGRTMRPYLLDSANGNEINWNWIEKELLGTFRDRWKGSRNKIKTLRQLAQEGQHEVERNLNIWRLDNKYLVLPPPIANDGFVERETPLLDAIELLDLHLSSV
jgi:hypothetical protein